ncbi:MULTISPECIES: ABC transporter ATP-binding protein [unclassified Rhodococcus (in: high G+C Gram-positive bacteria)]|uniref:ABC transporter ATP-binding protein n=1 Tax=unclassified Rhodococcus (in: high G+C Gram-positive bacteria) TaxID=192944 RepID=UPI00211B1D27|nr:MULTISPECIES: ABC transporter ATP-binding protein [unclassified Rhodococcus (in: high G+C Gram-positive bacteria)]
MTALTAQANPAAPLTARRIVRRTLTRNRGRLAVGTVLLCAHQIAETAVPLALGVIIDRGIADGGPVQLAWSIAALAVLFIALTTAFQVGMRQLNLALQREAHLVRMEVSGRVLSTCGVRTPLSDGEMLTVSSSDAEQAAWFLDLFPRMAAAATAVLATAVALFVIDVPLGLAVLLGTPLFMALLRLATPLITARTVQQQSRVAKATAMAGDLVVGLRSLQGIGAQHAASARYRAASTTALNAALATVRSLALQRGVTTTVSALIAACVASLAGWFALDGRISIGELIAVVGLAQFLIEPLTLLTSAPAVVARARGSAERVSTVLSAPSLLSDGPESVPVPTGLSVRNVTFRSLAGIDIDARPGEFVAVIALDPSDGDALATVLGGQVASDEYSGDVMFAGVSMREVSRESFRTRVLAEPHTTDLFAGSLIENIVGFETDTDRGHLDAVLSASAADQVATVHRDGLEHRVNDRGQNLSGGQRQRLALARALYARPPVLVLHEPTTAVDAVTEQAIADGIRGVRHSADRDDVTVVVTSSPALLATADVVVVLRDGHVSDTGTHADLTATNAEYAEAVLR